MPFARSTEQLSRALAGTAMSDDALGQILHDCGRSSEAWFATLSWDKGLDFTIRTRKRCYLVAFAVEVHRTHAFIQLGDALTWWAWRYRGKGGKRQ